MPCLLLPFSGEQEAGLRMNLWQVGISVCRPYVGLPSCYICAPDYSEEGRLSACRGSRNLCLSVTSGVAEGGGKARAGAARGIAA